MSETPSNPTATTTPTITFPKLAGREETTYYPGLATRDVQLIERLATDLGALARAIRKSDTKTARDLFPKFLKLPREAERVKILARRAARAGSA